MLLVLSISIYQSSTAYSFLLFIFTTKRHVSRYLDIFGLFFVEIRDLIDRTQMFSIPLFRGPSEVDWLLGKRALLGGQSQLRSGTIPTTGSWTSSAARGVGGYLSGRGCTQRRESDLARLRFFSAAAWRRWRGGFLCLSLILNERRSW